MFQLIATYFAGDEVCTASMASHFAINISKHSDAGDVLLAPSRYRLEHISQVPAFLRQFVGITHWMLLVRSAHKGAGFFQSFQAISQKVGWNLFG